MMIRQITQRLSEINTLLTDCKQEDFSFEKALPLSLFYRDFSDTNSLVGEVTGLAMEVSLPTSTTCRRTNHDRSRPAARDIRMDGYRGSRPVYVHLRGM